MAKLVWLVFYALLQSLKIIYVSGTTTIGPSWLCPPVSEVGTECQCNTVKSVIYCNGVTAPQMEKYFRSFKSVNKAHGAHVDLFRLENYKESFIDVAIFTPCTDKTYDCSDNNRMELTFGSLDIRGNKNLVYIGTWSSRNTENEVSVQKLLASNCSLNSEDRKGWWLTGLRMFGSKLQHVDFSHNHLTELEAYSGMFNLEWPNLKSLNLSHNHITDIGFCWFAGTPNVEVIDLSNNYIQNIWNEAFTMNNPQPDKYDTEILIDLSNNKLTQTSRFYDSIFEKLKRPTKIMLNHNDLNFLPQHPFDTFLNKAGNSIDMSNNQLICNCQSEWLRSMAVIYEKKLINYDCLNLNNSSIFKVQKSLCNC